jgi:hypothetical protein
VTGSVGQRRECQIGQAGDEEGEHERPPARQPVSDDAEEHRAEEAEAAERPQDEAEVDRAAERLARVDRQEHGEKGARGSSSRVR